MPTYTSGVRPPVYTIIGQYIDHLLPYLQSTHSPERSYPLLIADHGYPPSDTPILYYNTEQLTRKREYDRITERLRNPDIVEIWDYSTANIAILRAAGFMNVRHVPVSTCPETVEKLRYWIATQPKEYDIAFCGAQSPRRDAILQPLQSRGLRVHNISAWGDERDKEITRCHVLLNIHYADDFNVFESVRCDPLLAAGMPVITETSLDNDPRCAVIVPYNELVEQTISFLSHQRARSSP